MYWVNYEIHWVNLQLKHVNSSTIKDRLKTKSKHHDKLDLTCMKLEFSDTKLVRYNSCKIRCTICKVRFKSHKSTFSPEKVRFNSYKVRFKPLNQSSVNWNLEIYDFPSILIFNLTSPGLKISSIIKYLFHLAWNSGVYSTPSSHPCSPQPHMPIP